MYQIRHKTPPFSDLTAGNLQLMNNSENFLISIIGRDQVGVISDVTGYLFDIGANLADSSYAVLGQGFEFSAVASFGVGQAIEDVTAGLSALPLLEDARISVVPFDFATARRDSATITHTVEITGGDRPGLVARISEVLMDYNANIVRMSSKRHVDEEGNAHYRTRFAICIDGERVSAVEAALYNTAGSLRLECSLEAV